MPNTYVVTSNTAVGDQVTIAGTVDGIPVTVGCWLSHLQSLRQNGGLAAVRVYVASLMLAQAAPPPPVVVTQLPTGTFVL